jgi:hypothetical protein
MRAADRPSGACIGAPSAFVGNPGLRYHRFSRAVAEAQPLCGPMLR